MSLSHVTVSPDELVRRYVERVRGEIEPDPLFRRRLRGLVTNRFVAAREGLARPTARRPQMGKLGRACLYASFALGVSVGGVMAASRAAVPGDLLYPVKLQVEALRMAVLPADYRDALAIFALSERIHEMGRLAEAGDWAGVAALASAVEAGYAELEALGISDTTTDGALETRIEVLEMVRDHLPAQAQAVIDRVLAREPGSQQHSSEASGAQTGAGGPPTFTGQDVAAPATFGSEDEPVAQPAVMKSTPTAQPTPTARPARTSEPTPSLRVAPQQPSPNRAAEDGDRGNAQPEDGSQD